MKVRGEDECGVNFGPEVSGLEFVLNAQEMRSPNILSTKAHLSLCESFGFVLGILLHRKMKREGSVLDPRGFVCSHRNQTNPYE